MHLKLVSKPSSFDPSTWFTLYSNLALAKAANQILRNVYRNELETKGMKMHEAR